MRLRFAPSPTGQLHVGNARTALFNWLLARGGDGVFVLRIEDTDAQRSSREAEASIIRDLRWLGLDWNEGPDTGGQRGPYRASERSDLYERYAGQLLDGGLAYHCFCSPEQLDDERRRAVAAGRPTVYSGRCRSVSRADADRRMRDGERAALRFRVPADREVVFEDAVRGCIRFHTAVIGDPVILRTDGTPAYNFAVVVDDALMGITHVIRGEDHLSNTPRQLLLFESLGFAPPLFAHVALVMGPDHSPLSKRHGSTSVAEFRAKGYLPEALVNYLALIGWSPREPGSDESELMPAREMAKRFSLDRLGVSAGVFDEEKLAWVNRHYLKVASAARLAELSVGHFVGSGLQLTPDARGLDFLASAMPMISASVDRLDQVPQRLAFLFNYAPTVALADSVIADEMRAPEARVVAVALASVLAAEARLDRDRFRSVAGVVKTRTGQKGRALFHPIRIVLTGHAAGPELDLAVPAIDRGAELPSDAGLPEIIGCRERAAMFVRALGEQIR